MLLNIKAVVLLTFGILCFREALCTPIQVHVAGIMRSLDDLSPQLESAPIGTRRFFLDPLINNIKKLLGLSSEAPEPAGSTDTEQDNNKRPIAHSTQSQVDSAQGYNDVPNLRTQYAPRLRSYMKLM